MATTKSATVINPVAQPEPINPDAEQAADELERLRAEHRATRERIKALQAQAPVQTKLDREIARQHAAPFGWVVLRLGNAVRRRVRYGQPLDAALDAVLTQYRALLAGALAQSPNAELPTEE